MKLRLLLLACSLLTLGCYQLESQGEERVMRLNRVTGSVCVVILRESDLRRAERLDRLLAVERCD